MARTTRRIAFVCLTPLSDGQDSLGSRLFPSFGVRRMMAAVVGDPALEGAEVRLFDLGRADVPAYVDALEAFEPDLVGFSVYVWSTPCLVDVARRLKERRPGCITVFGGPSARTAVFDLSPYAQPHSYLDAVVCAEGEVTFSEIARLPELGRRGLESVPGLDLPLAGGWTRTARRPPLTDLDAIPSPFGLGLMPQGSMAPLETYRGCPMSCTFCEWGEADRGGGVFSTDYLVRELEAIAATRPQGVFHVDAGLNLNARAFRNFRAAVAQVDLLGRAEFWCEMYPSHATQDHLDFLCSIRTSYISVGLQSIDPAVGKELERPFRLERFEKVIRELAATEAMVEVQIIMGLPGDSPDGFRRTLDYARSLPVEVRANHCLVLPDALLTRDKPEWEVTFEPVSMKMVSCLGWSAEDIRDMQHELSEGALRAHGVAGEFWWAFPQSASD